jgi:hypothetical protein
MTQAPSLNPNHYYCDDEVIYDYVFDDDGLNSASQEKKDHHFFQNCD